MTVGTNHVVKALERVGWAETSSIERQHDREVCLINAATAQVHATLAVAEAIENLARSIVENLGRS